MRRFLCAVCGSYEVSEDDESDRATPCGSTKTNVRARTAVQALKVLNACLIPCTIMAWCERRSHRAAPLACACNAMALFGVTPSFVRVPKPHELVELASRVPRVFVIAIEDPRASSLDDVSEAALSIIRPLPPVCKLGEGPCACSSLGRADRT